MLRLLYAAAIWFGLSCVASAGTVPSFSVGMNLAPISPGATEQPFLNIMKQGGGWFTHNSGGSENSEEVALYTSCLDSNGYVTALPCTAVSAIAAVVTTILNGTSPLAEFGAPPYYVAGAYLFLYDGSGTTTFTFGNDGASYTCPVTGQATNNYCVITVSSPSNDGIVITQTATGAGANYAKNFRLIYCGTYSASAYLPSLCSTGYDTLLAGGEMFDPRFIALIKPFKTLRFMDWLTTVYNFQTNWTDRRPLGWVFWADSPTNATINGASPDPSTGTAIIDPVPIEAVIALCNEVGANCWFNMPPLSNSTYVTNFAACVHNGTGCTSSGLNSPLVAYVEWANEPWNQKLCSPSGTMTNGCVTQVSALDVAVYPGDSALSDFQKNTHYSEYRAVKDGAAWVSAWGADSGRVVRIFNGWNGNTGYNSASLPSTDTQWSGSLASNVDALAVAPYFGYAIPDAWSGNVDGGLTAFFTDLNSGLIPEVLDTGNCGNGAGITCDSGGTSAFTFTTSQIIADPPANGTMIAVQMNATNGANPTLTVTGAGGSGSPVTAPILANDGSCSGTPIGTGTLGVGGQDVFAYTSAVGATCTGSGPITAGWRAVNVGYLQAAQVDSANGAIGQTIAGSIINCGTAHTNGVAMVSYEAGFNYVSTTNQVAQTLLVSALADSRMYTAFVSFVNDWKNITGGCAVGTILQYNDIEQYYLGNVGQYWGSMQNRTASSTQRYNALLSFTGGSAPGGFFAGFMAHH